MTKETRCEGYKRYGGAFTLGPVKWVQCKEDAIVFLKVIQDKKEEEFPACQACWQECIDNGIKITSVLPMPDAPKTENL